MCLKALMVADQNPPDQGPDPGAQGAAEATAEVAAGPVVETTETDIADVIQAETMAEASHSA